MFFTWEHKAYLTLSVLTSNSMGLILIYLGMVNLLAFGLFGFDKARSTEPGARRIRERTLWLSMLFGGSLGALLAMHFFRHKTKKLSFQSVAALILMLQALLFVYIYSQMQSAPIH